MRATISCFLATAALVSLLHAQSPTPVVVQAMTPAMTPAPAAKAPATVDNATSIQGALKSLQALKAANEEILKQQAETLIKLDEIEKAAQEIRIYTKRG